MGLQLVNLRMNLRQIKFTLRDHAGVGNPGLLVVYDARCPWRAGRAAKSVYPKPETGGPGQAFLGLPGQILWAYRNVRPSRHPRPHTQGHSLPCWGWGHKSECLLCEFQRLCPVSGPAMVTVASRLRCLRSFLLLE